jgi:hypothetical protein
VRGRRIHAEHRDKGAYPYSRFHFSDFIYQACELNEFHTDQNAGEIAVGDDFRAVAEAIRLSIVWQGNDGAAGCGSMHSHRGLECAQAVECRTHRCFRSVDHRPEMAKLFRIRATCV